MSKLQETLIVGAYKVKLLGTLNALAISTQLPDNAYPIAYSEVCCNTFKRSQLRTVEAVNAAIALTVQQADIICAFQGE